MKHFLVDEIFVQEAILQIFQKGTTSLIWSLHFFYEIHSCECITIDKLVQDDVSFRQNKEICFNLEKC